MIENAIIEIPFKPLPVKNMKRAIVRKNGTPQIVDSPEARAYKKQLLDYLIENYQDIQFEGKVSIGYHFMIYGNGRIDCSNMIQGIEDMLQKAGIIEDDTWQKCSISFAEASPAKSKKEEKAVVYIYKD